MQVDPSFPSGQGGARIGAGRPKGAGRTDDLARAQVAAAKAAAEAEHDPFGEVDPAVVASAQPRVDYMRSKAIVEAVKAKNSELHYKIKLGQYVDRDAVKSACALVMSSFAQGMRSMQDDMERKLNLAPNIVEAIGEYVDGQLEQLASGFELLTGAKDE